MAWSCFCLALGACARPAAPVLQPGEPTAAPPSPAPAWLPEGWSRAASPAGLRSADALLDTYTKTGCLAPLLVVATYPPERAAKLAERGGGDAVAWLTEALHDSAGGPGTRVGEARPWERLGLVEGRRFDVVGGWPEGRAGVLDGQVAVGSTRNGTLVAAIAMVPKGDDAALVESLLTRLPLDLSRPPAVQSQAVGDHAD